MTGSVLDEHCCEAFERAERCTVNHHRSLLRVVLSSIFEVEALWQIVVDLDSTELPTASDSIFNHEVELRTVESCLTLNLVSLQTLLAAGLTDGVLTLVPDLVRTDIFLGVLRIAERNLCLVVAKTKYLEDFLNDVDNGLEFSFHLIRAYEDMSIVLSECAHTCKSVKLTALLVAEHCSELRDTQWKILIRPGLAGINLAVVRAVHRFEHILLVLLRCVDGLERVLTVVSVVTRSDIQVLRSDTRSDNLLIVIRFQNTAEKLLKAQTKLSAFRQPDRQTLTHTLGEHEEFHFLSDLSVVALLGLLEHDKILVEHLLLRERDSVDTCHLLTLGIATPESTCNTCYLDGLDVTGRQQVRTGAEVGEVALSVCSDRSVFQIL